MAGPWVLLWDKKLDMQIFHPGDGRRVYQLGKPPRRWPLALSPDGRVLLLSSDSEHWLYRLPAFPKP